MAPKKAGRSRDGTFEDVFQTDDVRQGGVQKVSFC